jgi:hypothetical protein
MDGPDQALDERACERLIYEYARLVDFNRAEQIADLFTHEGTWESGRMRWVGQSQVRAGFRRRQFLKYRKSRHICTNVMIELLGPSEARGLTYFIIFRNDGNFGERPAPLNGEQIVGEYHDRFVRVGEVWRFASRLATVSFSNRLRRRSRRVESVEL